MNATIMTITTDQGTRHLRFLTRQGISRELAYYGVPRRNINAPAGTFRPATSGGIYEIDWAPETTQHETPAQPAPVRPSTRPSAPVPPAVPVAQVTAGIYRVDGRVYQVKPNREGTRVYAKRLVEIGGTRVTDAGTFANIDFRYEAGAIFRIRPEHRVSPQEAAELSVRYGRCMMCGRMLRAAQSVTRAIGPVCWERMAG